MTDFSEPFTFKSGATLANRLLMSPMTTRQSFFDGAITSDEIEYYTDRAHGLGAVITGAANVQDDGKGWPGELSVAHDSMIPGLTRLAKGIQSTGSQAIMQIVHAGRMTDRATLSGVQTVSASAVAAERPNAETPRALSTDEVRTTIAAFGAATRRAIQAGFDGIELHGANTYLIQQFFSPHSNRRTDKYGGSRENRYRFIAEMLQAVFSAVDEFATRPFIVGYRVSPEEFETPGIRFDDTLWLTEQLAASRLDYLHLSLNKYDRVARDTQYAGKTLLAHVHAALNNRLPLIGVGGIRTRSDVSNVLTNADFVAVGQQLLYDPTWAVKLTNGADNAILTIPFAEAVKLTPLQSPLHSFAAERYQGPVNI